MRIVDHNKIEWKGTNFKGPESLPSLEFSFSRIPSVADIRRQALGEWEKTEEYEGETYRRVKKLGHKQESVSFYNADGELVYQWTVDYRIDVKNGLPLFTFWNGVVTFGDDKGRKLFGEERSSYVFRIHDGKWCEAHGFFAEATGAPSFDEYTRVDE
jgi:hypothetical protein